MKRLLPLMQREWLQHRFGWALLLLVPMALAALLLTFGEVQIGDDKLEKLGGLLPILLAMASMAGTAVVIFFILWATSLIIVSGIARRDHGDRSIEFWLSMPATHSESLAAPLLVHLLLVPAAALLLGLLGGLGMSLVLVTRVAGFGAWLGLPWGDLLLGAGTVVARLMVGLPLATLWLAPLILLVVLLTAWFRRWAWVILGVGLGLGSQLLDKLFGQPLLAQWLGSVVQHAARALVSAGEGFKPPGGPEQGIEALRALPGWALRDMGFALKDLASPLMVGGLLLAAGCFALLVLWRQRGAGAAGA
jgi:hypothetical protein